MPQEVISLNCIIQVEPLTLKFNIIQPKTETIYYIVYKTTNLSKNENEEKRFYIGKHIQINVYSNEFDGYYGSGNVIKSSIKKYGKENFVRETLEVCENFNHMNEQEVFWIQSFSANRLKYPDCGGMNLSFGGAGDNYGKNHHLFGTHHNEATKQRLREINIGKKLSEETKRKIGNSLRGKKHSEETKNKIRSKNKGRTFTEEQKAKISKNRIYTKGKDHPNFGKCLSEETKQKISQSNNGIKKWLGKKHSEKSKEKIKENHADFSNGKSPCCKYNYFLSNNENFYSFFDKNERILITGYFWVKKSNIIKFKDVFIVKLEKSSNLGISDAKKLMEEFNEKKRKCKFCYFLDNNEIFETFFDKKDKNKIRTKFNYSNSNVIKYKNVIITRIKNNEDSWQKCSGNFWELINFSDCEGVIGCEFSKKLYNDFLNFEEKAKTKDEYFYNKYILWKEAFKIASDDGCVSFH